MTDEFLERIPLKPKGTPWKPKESPWGPTGTQWKANGAPIKLLSGPHGNRRGLVGTKGGTTETERNPLESATGPHNKAKDARRNEKGYEDPPGTRRKSEEGPLESRGTNEHGSPMVTHLPLCNQWGNKYSVEPAMAARPEACLAPGPFGDLLRPIYVSGVWPPAKLMNGTPRPASGDVQ